VKTRKVFDWFGFIFTTKFVSLVSIYFISGCSEYYLKVEPENICSQDKVVAEWKVETDNPSISSSPEGIIRKRAVSKKASGNLKINWELIPSNGEFEVVVGEKNDEVAVVPAAGDSLTMSFSPDCKSGYANWAGSLLPSKWGTNTIVRNVGNFTGREITVTYAGSTQTIPRNGTSNVWNGLGLTDGDWAVSTKLEETNDYYEACNEIGGIVAGIQKLHKLPPTIKLSISYGCK